MAGLIEFFMQSFAPKINPNNYVDIKPLVEFWSNCSPITLKYNQESLNSEIRSSIIANLCAIHRVQGQFPQYGFDALKDILNQAINDDSVAQWILCVHLTKINDTKGDGSKLSFLLNAVKAMIVNIPDLHHQSWIELGQKVVRHNQIIDIVASVLQKFGVKAKPPNHIRFVIVRNEVSELRGFSGLNTIYINCEHYQNAFEMSFKNAERFNLVERVELASKMSLIALAIHEFGHIKLREAHGDFNLSTPTLAAEMQLPDDHKEFGALCEIEAFGSHVDWNKSRFGADLCYMRSFLNAIETGTELPKGPLGLLINRSECEHFSAGVDMDSTSYYD
ncbi:uncharacterized protein LOC119085306 [Bradysia coprophila]|uniref:uncharacterized protein LOC119085306 n=1 Tax=Bradysia coprophila TaxID=38358 RepID=UPI00187D90B4|nr:uncharacterized protein LOC119085306 [Bradysia coprophila]